jgi:Na+/proline symporter
LEVNALVNALHSNNEKEIDASRIKVQEADKKNTDIRKQVTSLMKKNYAKADVNDTNYVFLSFVTQQLPVGVVGILIAIIFLAAMGSTASGLNSLASTTVVDFYKRIFKKTESDENYLSASRWATVLWGLFCIAVAFYASRLGNLIEAVNILGSLFYGTILGIFLVAFYMKRVGGAAVFYAAILAEAFIVYAWIVDLTAFLWLNVIGCLLVMIFAFVIQFFLNKRKVIA